ncbi:tyrosine-type recombinase/integrase [Neobacillus sp. BF23-41]|uniref:tyrosine-type recombinase/integrase n=1 Tax=Neobacillus sp. BF23-41 TaxID=3240280 RepID=UPI0034E40E8A
MLIDYLTYLNKKGKSRHTVISYMNDLHQFFDATGIHPEDYVTETDIRKWVAQMMRPSEGKPLAVSTINRRLNALRSFYSWGRRNKEFHHNPMDGIEDLKSADEDHENIMWLTEEEFEDLLIRMRKTPVNSRGVDPEEKYRRDRAVVYLLTYAGLRVEELSNLKLTDLDLEMKRIRVVGKGNKVRTIPISNILLQELHDWLKFRSEMANKKEYVADSPYVFYSQRSPQFSIRGIQTMIESYSTLKRKLTPHQFRHTFCKWMLKATGNDIEKVRRLAGHSNIATTSRYLKDSYQDLADAIELLPKF